MPLPPAMPVSSRRHAMVWSWALPAPSNCVDWLVQPGAPECDGRGEQIRCWAGHEQAETEGDRQRQDKRGGDQCDPLPTPKHPMLLGALYYWVSSLQARSKPVVFVQVNPGEPVSPLLERFAEAGAKHRLSISTRNQVSAVKVPLPRNGGNMV